MDGYSQYTRRHQGVSFQLAFSRLEIFANRLWKIAEPDTVDVVYGRLWLHSLELAHRFSGTTVADALAGIHFTDEQSADLQSTLSRSSISKESIISVHSSESSSQSDDSQGTEHAIKIDSQCCDLALKLGDSYYDKHSNNVVHLKSPTSKATQTRSREGRTRRCTAEQAELTEVEKHTAFCRLLLIKVDASSSSESAKEIVESGADDVSSQQCSNYDSASQLADCKSPRLRYARPGCVDRADIVTLIRVPVELSCSDPDLFRLLHAVHSDQVRLLWMTPAQCPPGLCADPFACKPATMFYRTPYIDDRYRSRPGPIRRPLLVPCKLRHIYAKHLSRRRHRTENAMATESFRKQLDARRFKPVLHPSKNQCRSELSVSKESTRVKGQHSWSSSVDKSLNLGAPSFDDINTPCPAPPGGKCCIKPTISVTSSTTWRSTAAVWGEAATVVSGMNAGDGVEITPNMTDNGRKTVSIDEECYRFHGSAGDANVVMETKWPLRRRSVSDSDLRGIDHNVRLGRQSTAAAVPTVRDANETQSFTKGVPIQQFRHDGHRHTRFPCSTKADVRPPTQLSGTVPRVVDLSSLLCLGPDGLPHRVRKVSQSTAEIPSLIQARPSPCSMAVQSSGLLNNSLRPNVSQLSGKLVPPMYIYHSSLLLGQTPATLATVQEGAVWPPQVPLQTYVTSTVGQLKQAVISHRQHGNGSGHMVSSQQRNSTTCATAWSNIPIVSINHSQPINEVIGLPSAAGPMMIHGNPDTSVHLGESSLYLHPPPPLIQVKYQTGTPVNVVSSVSMNRCPTATLSNMSSATEGRGPPAHRLLVGLRCNDIALTADRSQPWHHAAHSFASPVADIKLTGATCPPSTLSGSYNRPVISSNLTSVLVDHRCNTAISCGAPLKAAFSSSGWSTTSMNCRTLQGSNNSYHAQLSQVPRFHPPRHHNNCLPQQHQEDGGIDDCVRCNRSVAGAHLRVVVPESAAVQPIGAQQTVGAFRMSSTVNSAYVGRVPPCYDFSVVSKQGTRPMTQMVVVTSSS